MVRQKVISAAVVGGLLVGSAFIAGAAIPDVAGAQENQDQGTEKNDERFGQWRGAIFEEVLVDLVAAGTITEDQRDEITEAVVAKAEELRAQHQELRAQIAGFLDDGVISAEELAQLPDDHPFNDPDGQFGDALEDGELTREEIREARPFSRGNFFKQGARFGALLDDGGIDQEEYDSLPEDHPLKQADVSAYLEDGVISLDELRQLRRGQDDSGDAA
jgi:hypothetical protein